MPVAVWQRLLLVKRRRPTSTRPGRASDRRASRGPQQRALPRWHAVSRAPLLAGRDNAGRGGRPNARRIGRHGRASEERGMSVADPRRRGRGWGRMRARGRRSRAGGSWLGSGNEGARAASMGMREGRVPLQGRDGQNGPRDAAAAIRLPPIRSVPGSRGGSPCAAGGGLDAFATARTPRRPAAAPPRRRRRGRVAPSGTVETSPIADPPEGRRRAFAAVPWAVG